MEDKNSNLDDVYKEFTLDQLYAERKTAYKMIIIGVIGAVACGVIAIATEVVGLWVGAVFFGLMAAFAPKRLPAINERITAIKEIEALTLDHSWDFPVHEFYERCKQLGITDSSTEFARKKIQNTAKNFMTEKKVPEASQGWYIEKAVDYFDAESKRIINETASEEKRWKTSVHFATPSMWEQETLNKAKGVKALYGKEKREFLLLFALEKAKESLDASKKSEIKPVLQKEKDWAVHGGIANGIAGSAAGAVTAVKIMKDNEDIRANNARIMNAAFLVNQKEYLSQSICRKNIDEYEAELRALPEKVIFESIDSSELLSAFQISVVDISRYSERSDDCMHVRLSVKQTRSLHLDIPDGVKIVLDGSIFGKVYTSQEQSTPMIPGGMEMGEIAVPLDMYGIPYDNALAEGNVGKEYTVTGVCTRFYGDINTKYVCKLDNNHNLWLMER